MSISDFKGKKVAVVDDEEIGAKILAKSFEKLGFETQTFFDGESFLKHLRDSSEKPDLVFLDILMPGISGTGVLTNLREQFTPIELPVIMQTAKSEVADIVKALKIGANDYITKPVNPEVALARARTQLELGGFYRESLKKKEVETLNAMITTYCHEINNPLSIALSNIKSDLSKMEEKNIEKSREAMLRISNILKKINQIVEDQSSVEYVQYGNDGEQKMLKIK